MNRLEKLQQPYIYKNKTFGQTKFSITLLKHEWIRAYYFEIINVVRMKQNKGPMAPDRSTEQQWLYKGFIQDIVLHVAPR